MTKKILYWTSRFWPHIGGVEVLGLNLIPRLRQAGFDVRVITSHNEAPLPDTDEVDGIPIRRYHFLTALTRRDLPQMVQTQRALADFKRAFRPDLVHIHFSGPESLFHWQTARAHPAPTLISIHAIPNHLQTCNSLLAQTLQRATWVTTVSARMHETLCRFLPEIRDRSSVIYNGVAAPPLSPAALPTSPPVFLCLGRLVAWKGFTTALSAFARLLLHHPQARLIVAGDGPQRLSLQQQAHTLQIAHAVDFRGWIDPQQVAHCINESSALLIPSQQDENLPIVAIQAAQMARPVIASRVSGLPEIVKDNQTGLLVEPDDAPALAAAMCRLAQNPQEAQRLGRANHDYAAQHFNLPHCASQYRDLYLRLIDDHA